MCMITRPIQRPTTYMMTQPILYVYDHTTHTIGDMIQPIQDSVYYPLVWPEPVASYTLDTPVGSYTLEDE